MCRALLYLGSRTLLDDLLFKPDNSLVKQVYMPKMLSMLNLAGFGMKAWDRESESPALPFSYSADWLPIFDPNLKSLAEKVRVNCLLAHVRGVPSATEADVSPKNNHPFCFPGCLGREYGYHGGEWQTVGGSDKADTVIIASEPLTGNVSTWLEVPEYSMLCASTYDGIPQISLDYIDA